MGNYARYLFIFLLGVLVCAGCSTGDNPGPDGLRSDILVSYEARTGSTVPAAFLLELLEGGQYPDLDDFQVQPLLRYGVNVYKIVYRTTYNNREVLASGAVTLPDTSGALPILSYQHGTMLKESRVPSYFDSVLTMDGEMALNLLMGSAGFICSAPDYIGYGESSEYLHPYVHAPSLAAAGMDMLRAVKELCDHLGINYQNRYFLTGYSEGGYATLALQRAIESQYASEFPIRAVSAGAGPYDLPGTAQWMVELPALAVPAYPVFLLNAYMSTYGFQRDLGEIFRDPYKGRIQDGILDGHLTVTEVNLQLTPVTADLFTQSFIDGYKGEGESEFKDAFAANDLIRGWVPSAPLRLYHGTLDLTVPAFNSESAGENLAAAGAADVTYIPFPGRTHGTGIILWVKETIIWFTSLR